MKSFVWYLLFLVTTVSNAQVLVPDSKTSHVEFEIKNFGITVAGSVSGLAGSVNFDPDRPETSMVNLSLQVATIETGISLRNKHLKKKEFFDLERHPELTISSVSINKNNSGSYFFKGNLAIKGITRQISFPFTILPVGNGFDFTGMFTISRLDFGVGGNSLSLSDNVLVKFHIRGLKELP